MRICRLVCTRVRIPFRALFATAHGTLAAREGLILRLETDSGLAGWGEASAVPGFGGDSAEVEAALRRLGRAVIGRSLQEAEAILRLSAGGDSIPAHPEPVEGRAARFPLDTALHDLHGQAAALPVAALLAEQPATAVAVNATISAIATDNAVVAALEAHAAGFECIKLKAGVAASEEAEITRVAAVREAIGPAMALRIDANGAWEPEQAIRILSALEPARPEYVEQPVAAADLAGMVRVRAAIRTPVAADEAATCLADVRRVIEAGAADVIVIKPMLAGTMAGALAIAGMARDAGLGVTVTSTLDSGIGVAAALHLAASLPGPLSCGLATASLLKSDLLATPLPTHRGSMPVPQCPGLGVTVDPAALAEYEIGSWELRA